MFRIVGRLIGFKGEELKYNKEILFFMLIGSIIFFLFGVAHSDKGAELLYTNRLSKMIMYRAEKKGVSNEDIDQIITDFKETIPINVREFEVYDIKDRLENYIEGLKRKKNPSLNEIIDELEEINKEKDKEILIGKLKEMDLKSMLKEVSKEEIVKKNLQDTADWQKSVFLSNIYFILGTVIGMAFVIIKVVEEIKILNKKEKNIEG